MFITCAATIVLPVKSQITGISFPHHENSSKGTKEKVALKKTTFKKRNHASLWQPTAANSLHPDYGSEHLSKRRVVRAKGFVMHELQTKEVLVQQPVNVRRAEQGAVSICLRDFKATVEAEGLNGDSHAADLSEMNHEVEG